MGDIVCSTEPSVAEGVDVVGFSSGEPGGVVESTCKQCYIVGISLKATSTGHSPTRGAIRS